MKLHSKHLLTGNELSAEEILTLLNLAQQLKHDRTLHQGALANKHLALMFEKPSFRTRFSFTVGMQELGGHVVESVSQNRKTETPEDQIRVLQGYCHAVMLRTHDDDVFAKMSSVATIPVINGLSEHYHPCQTLADLLTLKETFQDLNSLSICYVGDGNNILHSLLLMAPRLGVNVHYCCPKGHEPKEEIVTIAKEQSSSANISAFQAPVDAVKHCHAIYTDVWTSMGFEHQNEGDFTGFQVNEKLMQSAQKNARFMHCMPMVRGKEVSTTLPDTACSAIFQQSENRMHVQKALLLMLLGENDE